MATRTIDTAIALSGEKEFNAQMKAVNSGLKTLKSDMALVSSEFKGAEGSTEALTAKQKILEQQTAQQQEKVRAYAEMLAKVTEEYGENSAQADKYKQALNSAQIQLNTFNRDLKETEDALANGSEKTEETSESVKELGKEADDSAKKGSKFGDVWKIALGNLAADAIKSGLKSAAEGIRNIATTAATLPLDLIKGTASAILDMGQAVYQQTVESAAYADNVLTMATNTGISTEKLQEYMYMAELTDTSVETITGSMVKMTATMDKVRDGNEAATAAFEKLGVSVLNENGNLRDNEEVFSEVIDALGQIPEGTDRDALAMEVFGKKAQDLNSLIAAGSDTLTEFAEEAHNTGAVLDEETLKSLGAVDDAQQRFNGTLSAMKTALGAEFAEPVEQILSGLTAIMQGDIDTGLDMIADGFDNAADIIDELLPKAEKLIEDLLAQFIFNLPRLVESGTNLINSLISGIAETLPDILPVMLAAILMMVKTLTSEENIRLIMEAGIEIMIQLILAIAQAVPELIPVILSAIDTMFQTLWDNRDALKDAGAELLKGLWQGIEDTLTWLWDKVKGLARNITGKVKEALGIASPSRVFADEIGKNMALGIGAGFADEMADVNREIADDIDTTFVVDPQIFFPRTKPRPPQAWTGYPTGGLPVTNSGTGGIGGTVQRFEITFNGSLAQLARVLQPEIRQVEINEGELLIE